MPSSINTGQYNIVEYYVNTVCMCVYVIYINE